MPLVSGTSGLPLSGGTLTGPLTISDLAGAVGNLLSVLGLHTTLTLDDDGVLVYSSDDNAGLTVQGTGGTFGTLIVQDSTLRVKVTLGSGSGVTIEDGTRTLKLKRGDASLLLAVILSGIVTAPADGDLSANDCALWFDPTNGASKLMVKAKQADGTVKTGSLALA